jgi:histidinol-phosphate aminotransferase
MPSRVHPQSGLQNLPIYIPGRPIEEIQRLYGIQDVVKLASNENPLGPSPKAIAAIERYMCKVNLYPDGQSLLLRKALAQHLKVTPDQIIAGNGADGLILATCMAYLEDNSEVIVSRSSFPIYDFFSQAMRACLIKTPLKNYGLDLTAMYDAITNYTKIIFVCNPNNPTGTIIKAQELDNFIKKIPDHILIVLDEAYYEFVDEPDYPRSLDYLHNGHENILILRTFSKIYGIAGLRLGYGISTPDILTPMNAIREPFAVNLIAQAAGIAALEDIDFVQRSIEANRAGRNYLYNAFQRLGLMYIPSQTNFILVELGNHASDIIEAMMRKGIITRPCSQYNLPNFARISIGTAEQNERLIKTLTDALQAI